MVRAFAKTRSTATEDMGIWAQRKAVRESAGHTSFSATQNAVLSSSCHSSIVRELVSAIRVQVVYCTG